MVERLGQGCCLFVGVALASAVWFSFVRFVVLCASSREGVNIDTSLGVAPRSKSFGDFLMRQHNKTTRKPTVENFQRALSILLFSLRFRVFFVFLFLCIPRDFCGSNSQLNCIEQQFEWIQIETIVRGINSGPPSHNKGVSWQQFNCRFDRHKALANLKKFYIFIVRMKIFREKKGKHFRTAKHLKSDSSTTHECIQQNKCKFMAN